MKKRFFLLALLASLSLSGCDALDRFFAEDAPTEQSENKEGEEYSSKDEKEGETGTGTEDPVTPGTPEIDPETPPEDEPVTPVTPGTPPEDDPVTPVTPDTPSEESEEVKQYYKSISTTATGATLKTQLYNLINITKAGWEYSELFDAYRKTDVRPDGKYFWDIYSDSSTYTLNDKRINASYDEEGDSINKEHIIPQSTFNEQKPMKSDPHHVLPSDGYVNNRRSNYPHGEVTGKVEYTSHDGCKLGTGTNNTKVFEPMSQYKGDIARIYFYFVTCYQNKMSSNTFSVFDKSAFPSIKSPFLELYLKWHKEDPVSDKEIIRNNEIYKVQKNRNPFIDHQEYAERIWGK